MKFSEGGPELLRDLRHFTAKRYRNRAHTVSDPLQGALLKLLVASIQATRELENGTFTGYSALYMACAVPKDGRIITC